VNVDMMLLTGFLDFRGGKGAILFASIVYG
jgi:hypothetical protein